MSQQRLNSLVAPGIVAVAVLYAFQAIVQLTHTPSGESTLEGVLEHVQVVSLAVALAAMVPAVMAIGRRAGSSRATRVTLIGMVALAVLCLSSAANSGDLVFFPVVAIPANLMWFGGFIALGIALLRAGVVERRYAFALPAVWIMLLPFSALGGGLVAAALWLAVNHRLGLLSGATVAVAAPARA